MKAPEQQRRREIEEQFVYFTEARANKLKQYKYACIDVSPFSKYVMQPFWNTAIHAVPIWMAPNLITFLGFVALVISFFIVAFYTPYMAGECPSWAYFVTGFCLWFYQTMDNLDGRQARRTKSSSPLGQLFDHGCDVLAISIAGITATSATQLGPYWSILSFWCQCTNFWFTTWEEYHTGVMYLGFINGSTEGITTVYLLYLLNAIFGASYWLIDMQDTFGIKGTYTGWLGWLLALQRNQVVALVSSVPLIFAALQNVYHVSTLPKERRPSFLDGFFQNTPFLILVGLSLTWLYMWPEMWYEHSRLMQVTVGFIFSEITILLIIAHLCGNERFGPLQPGLYPLMAAVAYVIFEHVFGIEFVPRIFIVLGLFFISTYRIGYLVVHVCRELTYFLGIKLFVIPSRREVEERERLAQIQRDEEAREAERAKERLQASNMSSS